jgi:hypothetical protein
MKESAMRIATTAERNTRYESLYQAATVATIALLICTAAIF